MNWVKTYDNTLKNGLHLEDWKVNGKYGQSYHVGNTASTKVFYTVPRFWQEAYTKQWHISSVRKQCSSIEEGKRLCEEHWTSFAQALLNDDSGNG